MTTTKLDEALAAIECHHCHTVQPYSEFYYDRRRKIFEKRCRTCRYNRENQRRQANPELRCLYAQRSRDHYKLNKSQYQLRLKLRPKRDWRLRDPEKEKAHSAVRSAIRGGYMVKPDRCDRCRIKTPSKQLHGHHADYKRFLDVTWLCTFCHGLTWRKYE